MSAVRKPFNRALYQAFDASAKEALVELLQKQGHTIELTAETFNADVVSRKGGHTYFNEVEVKTAWKGDWPEHWAEIRLPERKKRLVDMYHDKGGFLNFYIFSPDFKQAWRIKDSLLTEDIIRVAKGRYILEGEKFYHVPYESAELLTLD